MLWLKIKCGNSAVTMIKSLHIILTCAIFIIYPIFTNNLPNQQEVVVPVSMLVEVTKIYIILLKIVHGKATLIIFVDF